MAPETREWSVPAPVRTLLWWPAISFVLVVVDPEAATGVIVGAGLVLALLGGLLAAAARRLTRRREALVARETTMEIPLAEFSLDGDLPTARIPRVPTQRDAA
ncbi:MULTISPECIES: hypothetical protein [unclassified Pseudonocardia]|jgi:hypothetical protein|uniref:hypothetical protein n=1 Tax=unclassified Pseudonocardia TaxID=2619320 RepID=UPI00095B4B75|nr:MULTISPECIES: hypothetical protein [unclassified Pseudonocardia]MBN9101999.1 hypothetical protein [Pseudonocardia sp.]OJY47111.1 MAG: hypothetical protein BGP03_11315 [Pseudonocardia sp. 73-21]